MSSIAVNSLSCQISVPPTQCVRCVSNCQLNWVPFWFRAPQFDQTEASGCQILMINAQFASHLWTMSHGIEPTNNVATASKFHCNTGSLGCAGIDCHIWPLINDSLGWSLSCSVGTFTFLALSLLQKSISTWRPCNVYPCVYLIFELLSDRQLSSVSRRVSSVYQLGSAELNFCEEKLAVNKYDFEKTSKHGQCDRTGNKGC